jgi:hypothetical protein
MGENRDRFKDAAEIHGYAGIAPVTERSGKQMLGALALAVLKISKTLVYCMVRTVGTKIILGRSLLQSTMCKMKLTSGCAKELSTQVNAHII